MRSLLLLAFAGITCVITSGCSAEPKKIPETKQEDQAKLQTQHAAAQDAIKAGKDPAQAIAPGAATAPTGGGHGR